MADAIVAGHLCLDIIPDLSALTPGQFDSTFLPGRLVQSGPARLTTGGAVSNTGIALHRLGIDTHLIACTGEDQLGTTLRQCVDNQGAGLAAGLIPKAGSTTSYSIVISPPGTDRRFLHHPGANDDFSAQDVDNQVLEKSRLFHFGYPPIMACMYADTGKELTDLFRRVKSMGLTTSLDMAYPDLDLSAGRADWPAILQNVLPYVDVFVPSFDEITTLLWRKPDIPLTTELLIRMSCELMDMGTRIVMLKLGSRGLYLRTSSQSVLCNLGRAAPNNLNQWAGFEAWRPCFKVNVAGTTGAGDVTVAGFLAALLRGLSPIECMTAALAAGASCVEEADSLSGIRSWDDTWQRIKSGWEFNPEPEQFTRQVPD